VLYPRRFHNNRSENLRSFTVKLIRKFRITSCSVGIYMELSRIMWSFWWLSHEVAWGGWILLIDTEMRTVSQWRGVFLCHYSFWLLSSDVGKNWSLSQLFINLTLPSFSINMLCIARGSRHSNSEFIIWSGCSEHRNNRVLYNIYELL
jgi:hypothetical protein